MTIFPGTRYQAGSRSSSRHLGTPFSRKLQKSNFEVTKACTKISVVFTDRYLRIRVRNSGEKTKLLAINNDNDADCNYDDYYRLID